MTRVSIRPGYYESADRICATTWSPHARGLFELGARPTDFLEALRQADQQGRRIELPETEAK
jgi:hypothetical protein